MAPTTTNTTNETISRNINISTLIPNLMISIFGLVGLTGNAIVFWLLGFRLRRNVFTVYILNLALADFLFLFCHIISVPMFLLKFFSHNSMFLRCFYTFMVVLYIMGLSILSAISTEHCLSVLCPIWYHCLRPEHTSTVMCAAIWVLSLLVCIQNRYFCSLLDTKYVNVYGCLVSSYFNAAYLMILLVVLCLHSLALLARLFCGAGRMKLTRLYVTIMLTILVFLLCGLSFGLYWFLLNQINYVFTISELKLYQATRVLTAINSCANPIIYFFVGSFRHRLKQQTLKVVLQRALQDTPETAENMVEMSRSKAEP
ncbi:mas-related G-protein coupled receptor member A6-like [Mus pahari]|uniref:mas-related G-protein coupled receptor member A6-like n=1 Tax=Mus pahari TaxID=10093 RepID=UPI000A304885|nr:mas-related G-protein coupled receptor member A6-like [Mus pahari]